MISIFLFVSSIGAATVIAPDQYAALIRFTNETKCRSFALNQSACPDVISPPNVRVACNVKGQITHLHLQRANLQGNLTSTISLLTDLVYFNISDNLLVGNINALATLTNLETLDVSFNALSDDALSVVEKLPLLATCVLQLPASRDTNCFAGTLFANATVCNDAHANFFYLCRNPIPRVAQTSSTSTTTATTSPTTTSTTKTTTSTTTTKQPVATTTVAVPISTNSKVADTTTTASTTTSNLAATTTTTSGGSETTTVTTSAPVVIIISTDKTTKETENLENQTPSAIQPDTSSSHLAVVLLGVTVGLIYISATAYVVVSKIRKRRLNAAVMSHERPFVSGTEILDVEDIDSDKGSPRQQHISEYAAFNRNNDNDNNNVRQVRRSDSDYSHLPVNSSQVPAAVSYDDGTAVKRDNNSKSLRSRGSSLKSPPPMRVQSDYSQIPPPISDRTPNGSYVPVTTRPPSNYDRVVSTPTLYDKCESSLD